MVGAEVLHVVGAVECICQLDETRWGCWAGALSSLITDAIYDYRHMKQHGQNEEYSGAVYRYGDNDRVENRALLVSCTYRMVGVLGLWNE
ncbi:unnamed protein product [Fusarium graminearum]|nr:unnamed protein product [Fusarium graminearum]CAG2018028.1 unnamed protein product [Fusarium graminearum]